MPSGAQTSKQQTTGEISELVVGPNGLLDNAYNSTDPAVQSENFQLLQDAEGIITPWLADPQRFKLAQRLLGAIEFRDNMERSKLARQAWEGTDTFEMPADSVYWTRKSFIPAYDRMNPNGSIARQGEIADKWKRIWNMPEGSRVRFEEREPGGRRATLVSPDGTEAPLAEPLIEQKNPFDPANVELMAPNLLDQFLLPGQVLQESTAEADKHTLGIAPHPAFDIEKLFDETGHPRGGTYDSRYKLLPDASGFYLPEEVANLPAQPNDPDYLTDYYTLYGERENKGEERFINIPAGARGPEDPGEQIPLYDLRDMHKVLVSTENGDVEVQITKDWLSSMRRQMQGGIAGLHTITGKLGSEIFYPDEFVETPFGPMLTVKVTGNLQRDRALMQDPKWLRSIVESLSDEGPDFWLDFSQSALGLTEWAGSFYLGGKLARGAGKLIGEGLARAGEAAPLLATPGRIGAVWAETAASHARPLTASPFRFGLQQFAGNVGYEALRGSITGEGSWKDWIKTGVELGEMQYGVGLLTRGTFKLAGMGARGAGKLFGKEMLWAKRLSPDYLSTELGARAMRGAEQIATDSEVKIGQAIAGLRKSLGKEVNATLRTQSIQEVLHAGVAGFWIGSYLEGQKLAGREGKNWNDLALDEQAGYVARAFQEGNIWAHVASMMAVQASYLPRGLKKGRVAPMREIDDMLEAWRGSLEDMAKHTDLRDVIALVGGVEGSDASVKARFEAWQRSKADPTLAALDEDAPRPSKIEELEPIIASPGGRRRFEKALEILPDETLDTLLADLRAHNPEAAGRAERLGIREALEEEIGTRKSGGLRPGKRKLTREKGVEAKKPEDLPRRSWPDYFEPEVRETKTEGKKELYRLRGTNLVVGRIQTDRGPEWGTLKRRSLDQVGKTTFPDTLKGLRDAMGYALGKGGVLDLQTQAAEAAKQPKSAARKQAKPAAPSAPVPPTADEVRLADAIQAMIDHAAAGNPEVALPAGTGPAIERVVAAQEGTAQVMGKTRGEIASDALPPEALTSPEALEAHVAAVEAEAQPKVVSGERGPAAQKATEAPEGVPELEDALARSTRPSQERETLAAGLRTPPPAEQAQLGAAPGGPRRLEDTFGKGVTTDVASGHSFWSGQGTTTTDRMRATFLFDLASAELLGDYGSRDAKILGVLAATGGDTELVARVLHASPESVQGVWDKAADLGRNARAGFETALADLESLHGYPLLTPRQLQDPKTLELVSVLSVLPRLEFRRSGDTRGTASRPIPPELIAASTDGWSSAMRAELEGRGVGSATAAAATEAAIARIKAQAEGKALPGNVPDILGRLQSKIGQAVPGLNHRSGRSAMAPDGVSLGDLTTELVEAVGGSIPSFVRGERAESGIRTILSPEMRIESEAERVRHTGSLDTLADYYREVANNVRELVRDLAEVEIEGVSLLPRDSDGLFLGTRELLEDPIVRSVLRQLAMGSLDLKERLRASGAFGELFEGHWSEMVQSAAKALETERLTLRMYARERYGEDAMRQVIAADEALGFHSEHPNDPLPEGLRTELGKGTALFPDGALDPSGTQLSPFAERELSQRWYDTVLEAREAARERGDMARMAELQDEEMIPVFSFPSFQGVPSAMWTHKTYEWGFGWALSLGGKGLRGITDWAVHQPFFETKGGKYLLRGLVKWWFKPLIKFIPRTQSSGFLPSEVGRGNWKVRDVRLGTEARARRITDATVSWMTKVVGAHLTEIDKALLARAIDGDMFARFGPEGFAEHFGERGPIIHSLGRELIDRMNESGEWMGENGLLTAGQLRQLSGRYFPITSLVDTKGEKGTVLSQHRGSPRELPRSGHEEAGATAQMEFDPLVVVPPTIWSETMRNRMWGLLKGTSDSDIALLSSASYDALPGPLKFFYRKATEPLAGKRPAVDLLTPEERKLSASERAAIVARRSKSPLAPLKLHLFLEDESAFMDQPGGAPDTPIKREIIERFRDGYVSIQTQQEIDAMIEQLTRHDYGGTDLLVQAMVQHWRAVKTVRRPEHLLLQIVSGPMLNNATGRAALGDFVGSVMTGRGKYAEGSRHAWDYFQWLRDGKPELDPLSPRTARIRQFDAWAEARGGSTLVKTAFDAHGARDLLFGMYQASGADRAITDQDVLAHPVVRAATLANMRRAVGFGAFDSLLSELMSGSRTSHTAAIGTNLALYHVQELYWGYVNLLEGMSRGLSFKEASDWAGAGTGDIAERNVLLSRFTTNFTGGVSDIEKRARREAGMRAEPHWFEKAMRMGLGSPFWIWRSTAYPQVLGGIARFPLRYLATTAIGGMVVRAISAFFGGDEQKLQQASAGMGEWPLDQYDPGAIEDASKQYGDLDYPRQFGGTFPRNVGLRARHFLELMASAVKSPLFFTASGPNAGGVTRAIDTSQLLTPGLGEASQMARSVMAMAQGRTGDRQAGENLMSFIGFVPFSVGAAFVSMEEALFGVKGERLHETRIKAMAKAAGAWVPELSPAWPASLAGQDTARQILSDGATMPELAARLPSPRRPSTLTERLGVEAVSMAGPLRQASTLSVRDEGTSWQGVLRGIGLLPRESLEEGVVDQASGRMGEPISIRERKVHQAIGNILVSSYRQYLDPKNILPLQSIVAANIDLGRDLLVSDGIAYDVSPAPTSTPGKWLRRQSDDANDRAGWVTQWTDTMKQLGPILQDVVLEAGNRQAVPPEVFARIVNGVMGGDDGKEALTAWLYDHTKPDRPGWAEDYDGEFYRLWFDGGLDSRSFTGADTTPSREWKYVRDWIAARSVNPPVPYSGGPFEPALLDVPMGRGLEYIPRKRSTPFSRILEAIQ